MGRFGIPEDQPIENRLITRSLETAQTKIEGFNFDARKQVLEYDDVLNFQRKIVYERRRKVLLEDREAIDEYLAEIISLDEKVGQVVDDKKLALGETDFYKALRILILQATDMLWVEHLEVMDYLRGSVNLRAYGQRDPLVEYKKEGLRLFKEIYNVTESQFEKDLANAKKTLTETVKEKRKHLVGVALTRYEFLYNKNLKIQDYREARQVIDSINKLLGLNAPTKNEQDTTLKGELTTNFITLPGGEKIPV